MWRLDGRSRGGTACLIMLGVLCGFAPPGLAQEHDHAHMNMQNAGGWQVMQDAVVFAEFNRQGGDRGGSDFVAPNWWMGMADRHIGPSVVTLTGMFSLDPLAVGRDGYREIFQAGETLDGKPLVDRQHPHDFVMQLSASWRFAVSDRTRFSITGAAAGEPALGPVSFMHRASAADDPTAPLSHHTLDSTHISFGVITVGLDRGKWAVESSVFNGREPDDNRWDFDFGPFDSISGRVWFRPTTEWEVQVSSGRLKDPEALEPGNIVRSTASIGWTRASAGRMTAVTVAYGRNDLEHTSRSAVLIEGARQAGRNTVYARVERLQVETELLETRDLVTTPSSELKDPVSSFTVGGVRNVIRYAGLDGGLGADATFYRVPESLQPSYGAHVVSFHVFFRIRPAEGAMGRMWNMRMGDSRH